MACHWITNDGSIQCIQTSNETRGVSEVSYTTLISEVSGGNVRDVEISGDEITGTFNDGSGSIPIHLKILSS